MLSIAVSDNVEMVQRAYARTPVSLEAILISGMERYIAFVGNVSREGVYVMIALTEKKLNFIPQARLELRVHLSQDKTLSLHCRRKWAYKLSPDSLTVRIGMEIIDPPEEYREFLKTLD